MTLERIVGAGLLIVATSAAAAAQPPNGTTVQPSQSSSIREIVYSPGAVMTSREVRTRTTSSRGDVVVDAIELPGPDGRMRRVQETTSETLRTAPGISRTQQNVFAFDDQGRRTLHERTESEHDVSARGDTTTVVRHAWAADVNGRLALTSKLIETTSSAVPDTRDSVTTVLRPSPNEPLRADERAERTEHRIAGDGVRVERAELTRDLNGRWQPLETRLHVSRHTGAGEQIEEETVQRQDVNGTLKVAEKTVTRRSELEGRSEVLVETFTTEFAPARSDGLSLSRRTRISTASGAAGDSTIEETEARNPVAPDDPMRVIQRVVTTVRAVGPDRRIIERQVFELDVNNRLTLVLTESEEALEK